MPAEIVEKLRSRFALGEGLVGQSALERNTLHMMDLPVDYMPIVSALGQANTLNLIVAPLIHADNLIGVLEIAAYRNYARDVEEILSGNSKVPREISGSVDGGEGLGDRATPSLHCPLVRENYRGCEKLVHRVRKRRRCSDVRTDVRTCSREV